MWEHVWNLLKIGKLQACRHHSVMWEHVGNLLQVGKLQTCWQVTNLPHHSVRRLEDCASAVSVVCTTAARRDCLFPEAHPSMP